MILRSCIVLSVVVCGGCGPKPKVADKPPQPAKVANAAKESELSTIVLTSEGEQRLGIRTAAVERRAIRRRRTYGGEVVLPTGASIIVQAPVGGMLKAASEGSVPDVGMHVERHQIVFLLAPLLSKERDVLTPAERIALAQMELLQSQALVTAQGQLEQAQERVKGAQIDLDRAQRLFDSGKGVGTRAAVDTAANNLAVQEKALTAAEQACELLQKKPTIGLDADTDEPAPIPILSPRDGYIRTQQATIGVQVPAGAALFEVMDFDPIWIKVPVYGGEVASIAENEPTRVWALGETDEAKALSAEPVQAPPTADPQAATVDLYYSLANADGRLRPGQRLNASLALREQEQSLVIPYSAIEIDPSSGEWVYVMTAPQTFVRRRVQLAFVDGDLAVIENGPREGEQVVSVGAAELWGTEFGAGH